MDGSLDTGLSEHLTFQEFSSPAKHSSLVEHNQTGVVPLLDLRKEFQGWLGIVLAADRVHEEVRSVAVENTWPGGVSRDLDGLRVLGDEE